MLCRCSTCTASILCVCRCCEPQPEFAESVYDDLIAARARAQRRLTAGDLDADTSMATTDASDGDADVVDDSAAATAGSSEVESGSAGMAADAALLFVYGKPTRKPLDMAALTRAVRP